ncbi:hypothetical protein F0344_11380 [Streptomyces finlayi]|uniref:Uncharacterized protein n=1 Tax=Streptomyces finlayi TaxID=67296 RepID=A0A7G7BIG5_9ACTN|nr:hypothetical protein [Streptomyces finlayi]QNE75130.1 hypothetical protein F0344_11380 [Streptomyces finlayi]
MYTQLRATATELANVLWREHTVYRERGGGFVIRGEHVQRWISLAPTGGRNEALVRVGRILEGGTTAPARSEQIVSLDAATGELAATCRRLLADAAAEPSRPVRDRATGSDPGGSKWRRPRKPRRTRHTSFTSWVVIVCIAGVVGVFAFASTTH